MQLAIFRFKQLGPTQFLGHGFPRVPGSLASIGISTELLRGLGNARNEGILLQSVK